MSKPLSAVQVAQLLGRLEADERIANQAYRRATRVMLAALFSGQADAFADVRYYITELMEGRPLPATLEEIQEART